MAEFVNIEEVEEQTKTIVFGFIRTCQCLFEYDNPYYNIPGLVTHIIISYFAQIEYFEIKSSGLSVDTARCKLSKTEMGEYHAAYGHICVDTHVDKSIHRWVFKIINIGQSDINFGICGAEKKALKVFIGGHKEQYGVGCESFEWGSWPDVELEVYSRVPRFANDDIVTHNGIKLHRCIIGLLC